MFCKYCGNELKDKAKFCPKCGKSVTSDVTETVQTVKEQVNHSLQTAKEKIQQTDIETQKASLLGLRQRLQDIISHPKEHKVLLGILIVLIVAIIGLKGFVFTDERYITKNSDKMMTAMMDMVSGKPMDIDDVPMDGMIEAAFKGAAAYQKSNPGKFASIMPVEAMEKANITYKLTDVQIKKDTAIASYTLMGNLRHPGESVGMDIVWTDSDKKGWVITDVRMVKQGQSYSMFGVN